MTTILDYFYKFIFIFIFKFFYLSIDVSAPVNLDQAKCFNKNGYKSIYIRVWQSNNKFDINSINTIKNSRKAGIDHVDCYIFPCAKCGNAKNQISTLIKNLNSKNVKCDRFWIDVEGPQYWPSNKINNVNFIQQLINELKLNKQKIGIYTSNSQWQPITGGSNKFNGYPLWYPHYDSKSNFGDFKPFGGWKKPSIKQYSENKKICNYKLRNKKGTNK
ncbi:hypothetical protein Mgra_00008696 [Meloidogyne graminicola]|uniref:Lysozyme n=1 Tax=Meloidogyne graminicola TaxID=189291 RepID=A0A8S9ZF04_9BILA|nr:hypothetical protein Mgra_00008696 [Meloidogyne graminicola]